MLIQCPECELQASDKAVCCPHCGYPFQNSSTSKSSVRRSNKRRRLPNGFGQISEIKGRNLRNPFRAMITTGKTETGKPICELLKPNAYFPTYNDAYAALIEYNRNPYDLPPTITVQEVYDRWSEEYFKHLKAKSSVTAITSAWKYCYAIYDMPIAEVRTRHVKGCMNDSFVIRNGKECHPSANVKAKIKSVIGFVMDYAIEYELIDKNYSKNFNLPKEISEEIGEVDKEHIPFTDEEMEILWNNLYKVAWVDVILIQCYSGWRPQELGLIKLEHVDLENRFITGGIKTDNGIDRPVPIHSRIKLLIEKRYQEALEVNSEYLFNCLDGYKSTGTQLTYKKYSTRFKRVIKDLNLNPEHRPHDPRKHFVTMAKKYELNEYAIKYIVGHGIDDITEKIYTERDPKWLSQEIEKIR